MWGRLWQKTNNDNFVWKNLGSVTRILFAGTVIWAKEQGTHPQTIVLPYFEDVADQEALQRQANPISNTWSRAP